MKKAARRALCLALRKEAEKEEQESFRLAGSALEKPAWFAARGAARALRAFAARIETEGRNFLAAPPAEPRGLRYAARCFTCGRELYRSNDFRAVSGYQQWVCPDSDFPCSGRVTYGFPQPADFGEGP